MRTETIFSVETFCSHSVKSLRTEKDFHAHCAISVYLLSRGRHKSLGFAQISGIGSWGFCGCQCFVAYVGIRGMACLRIWSVPANPSALPVEVAFLRRVGRVPGSHSVGIGGRGGVAGHFEQVTADRVEPVVTGEHVGEFVGR